MSLKLLVLLTVYLLDITSGEQNIIKRFIVNKEGPQDCCLCDDTSNALPDCKTANCRSSQYLCPDYCMAEISVTQSGDVRMKRSCGSVEQCVAGFGETLMRPACFLSDNNKKQHPGLSCTLCCKKPDNPFARPTYCLGPPDSNYDKLSSLFTQHVSTLTTSQTTIYHTLLLTTSTSQSTTTSEAIPINTPTTSRVTSQQSTQTTAQTTYGKSATQTSSASSTVTSNVSTTHRSTGSTPVNEYAICHVCSGDMCHANVETCPHNKPYCMNIVSVESGRTSVLKKGCASYAECYYDAHLSNDQGCDASIMSSSALLCRYCCQPNGSGTPCNKDTIPSKILQYHATTVTSPSSKITPLQVTLTNITTSKTMNVTSASHTSPATSEMTTAMLTIRPTTNPTSEIKHANWSPWFYSPCSETCGKGTRQCVRICSSGHVEDCAGSSMKTEACTGTPCPVDGGWGSWQQWGPCSQTCGQGSRSRHRICDSPTPVNGGNGCHGNGRESGACNIQVCPNWSLWFYSPCTATCGTGTRQGVRICSSGHVEDCAGSSMKTEACTDTPCPVDGGWGNWQHWDSCSQTCGGGLRSRSRVCDSPAPAHGGNNCHGNGRESGACNSQGCPHWGPYYQTSACSVTCGEGVIQLARNCSTGYRDNCTGSPYDEKPCSNPVC